jgi:hypothetical protein
MKPINTLCGQNAELLNIKVGGTHKLPLCFKELKVIKLLPGAVHLGFVVDKVAL